MTWLSKPNSNRVTGEEDGQSHSEQENRIPFQKLL